MEQASLTRSPRFRDISESLARWVNGGRSTQLDEDCARWSPGDAPLVERALSVQSVAPFLDSVLEGDTDQRIGLARAIRSSIRERRRQNDLRNRAMRRQLASLLEDFHHENIPAIPLKGAWFAFHPLPGAPFRVMADIDFLITAPGDLERAADLLEARGFVSRRTTPSQTEWAPKDARVRDSLRGESPDNPIRIEIHSSLGMNLLGRPIDPSSRIASTARPGELLGIPATLPSEAEGFAHLFLHHSADFLNLGLRLGQALDLASLWNRIETASGRAAAVDAVIEQAGPLAGLFPALCAELLPSRIPADLVSAFPRSPGKPFEHFRSRPLLRLTRPLELQGWDALRLASGAGDRARILGSILFPRRDQLERALGESCESPASYARALGLCYRKKAVSLWRRNFPPKEFP